jgi:uncharacterized ubiquitin-like protein YukD
MATETAVNIGLHIGEITIDLRVPRFVTISRLKEIIEQALEMQKIPIPRDWELVVINKAVKLKNDIILANYPISDGDQLEIVSKERAV